MPAAKKRKSSSGASLPYRVPYARFLRALAFSNRSFESSLKLLDDLMFAQPIPEHIGRFAEQYEAWRSEAALRSRKVFAFSQYEAMQLGIDPFFSWAIFNGDFKRGGEHVQTAARIIEDLRNHELRRVLDTMLFCRRDPGQIDAYLQDGIKSPVRTWNASMVSIYASFFWDVSFMTTEDWNYYVKGLPASSPVQNYIMEFGFRNTTSLYNEVTLLLDIPPAKIREHAVSATFQSFLSILEAPDRTPEQKMNAALMLQRLDPFMKSVENNRAYGTMGADHQKDDPLSRIRVLLTEKERRAEGVTSDVELVARLPISVSELDGPFSDPRETRQHQLEE